MRRKSARIVILFGMMLTFFSPILMLPRSLTGRIDEAKTSVGRGYGDTDQSIPEELLLNAALSQSIPMC